MSTYEPGTVAVATVRGVPNVRVFRYQLGRVASWLSGEAVSSSFSHEEGDVTDVRPLVVLDLDDDLPGHIHALAECARSHGMSIAAGSPLDRLASALVQQIEAATKPPRAPEPTGFAPVVEAGVKQHDQRLHWVQNRRGHWVCEDRGEYDRLWSELIDPVLVRDGIEDGAS